MSTARAPANAPLAIASFRAKSAAVSLVLTFAVGAWYAANALGLDASVGTGMPDGAATLALVTLGSFVAMQVVLQTVLAVGAGRVAAVGDADRLAAAAGRRAAYPVLGFGALATFAAAFFGASPFVLANLALVAFVVAELVRWSAELLAYRRRA